MILVGPGAGRIGPKALLLLVEVIGRMYRFRKITMLFPHGCLECAVAE